MNKLLLASLALLIHGSAFAYDYSYSDDLDAGGSFYAGVGAGAIIGGDARDMCDNLDISCLSYKSMPVIARLTAGQWKVATITCSRDALPPVAAIKWKAAP
ncbi:MAG: hypothetical protein R3E89_15405 [Thiolinea sp.]